MNLTVITVPSAAMASVGETGRAVEIAVVGMLMVFSALALLTVFLTLLPRLLAWINALWPEPADHHAAVDVGDELLGEEDEVLAAIGFVLHSENRERQ